MSLHAGLTRDALLRAFRSNPESVMRLLVWAQRADRHAYVRFRSWLP